METGDRSKKAMLGTSYAASYEKVLMEARVNSAVPGSFSSLMASVASV